MAILIQVKRRNQLTTVQSWELVASKDPISVIQGGTFEAWSFLKYGVGGISSTREDCVYNKWTSHHMDPICQKDCTR